LRFFLWFSSAFCQRNPRKNRRSWKERGWDISGRGMLRFYFSSKAQPPWKQLRVLKAYLQKKIDKRRGGNDDFFTFLILIILLIFFTFIHYLENNL
jgi:hypothetical protein